MADQEPADQGPPESPKAPRRPKKTVAQTLLESDRRKGLPGLHGTLIANTHKSKKTLAACLGLAPKDLEKWMKGDCFQPTFLELYDAVKDDRMKLGGQHGPTLRVVQNQMEMGERHGVRKYSARRIDKTSWSINDHYAYCMFILLEQNSESRDGVFYRKQMSAVEKEARIWQAMLRATSDMGKIRRGNKSTILETPAKTPRSIYGNNSSSSKKRRTPSAEMRGLRLQEDDSETEIYTPTKQKGRKRVRQDIGPPIRMQPLIQEHPPVDEPALDANQPTPDANSDDDTETRGFYEEDFVKVDDMLRLRDTINPEFPLDITTLYGKHAIIHTIIDGYKDVLRIYKLKEAFRPSVEQGLQQFQESYDEALEAIEASIQKTKVSLPQTGKATSDRQFRLTELIDNSDFQPQEYTESCDFLSFEEYSRPRFDEMPTTLCFTGHQTCGIVKAVRMITSGKTYCVIFADATGLGKTFQLIGVWTYFTLEFERRMAQWQTDMDTYNEAMKASDEAAAAVAAGNEDGRPPAPNIPPQMPQKPYGQPRLLIVLPELVYQWYDDIKRMSPLWDVYIYHGDGRVRNGYPKIDGVLTQTHFLFLRCIARGVIITTLPTLLRRNGPSAIKTYRMEELGWSEKLAASKILVREPDCPLDLGGFFSDITMDEIHQLKNADTRSSALIQWWTVDSGTDFFGASADLTPNTVPDVEGYIPFAANQRAIRQAIEGGHSNIDPFQVADDHPAASLRFTKTAVKKFITDRELSVDIAGKNLATLYRSFVIRRTYASRDPQYPEKRIGDSIARLNSRQLVCKHSKEEYEEYSTLIIEPLKKLCQPGPRKDTFIWNARYFRRLVLLTAWTGFQYVEKHMMYKHLPRWKSRASPLWIIVQLFIEGLAAEVGDEDTAIPDVPVEDDIVGQLVIVCRGGPKIRLLLAVIANLVVLQGRKLVIWVALPASQILVWAILKALQIPCAGYTSELSGEERDRLVTQFTSASDTMVFIGTYHMGTTGLNLHSMCYHSFMFDTAPSPGKEIQALGRLQRMGQEHDVENFVANLQSSFQSRQMNALISKALPKTIAHLTTDLASGDTPIDGDEHIITMDKWYLVKGELLEHGDRRVPPKQKPLDATGLAQAIITLSRGEETQFGEEWTMEEYDDDE